MPPVITQPIRWFGRKESLVQVRLTSGSSLNIEAVRLYDELKLQELAEAKAKAMEMLDGVKNPYAAIGSPLWVVFSSTVTRAMETHLSEKSAQGGFNLLQQVAWHEKALRDQTSFFHVGQIQEIEHPLPSLWRVPSAPTGFVHEGGEFVFVRDSEQQTYSIRWGAVECYQYPF